MHQLRCAFLILVLIASTAGAPAQVQTLTPEAERVRREKVEEILRVQDLRTPHDGRILRAFSDRDPVIRYRACIAGGSLQDTLLLPSLVSALSDPDSMVQSAAAYAIGQTAPSLGERGRMKLEEEILWIRLRETRAKDDLIEAVGKFGREEALRQLMIRVGNTPPYEHQRAMQRALGRFAIRGVVSDEGVGYLCRFLRPMEETPWEVFYALQRIGDRPSLSREVDQILQFRDHRDPLLRMNLALLLGKLGDSLRALPPLQHLARFDPDWRVRVNAIRSLGSFSPLADHRSLLVLREAVADDHPAVIRAALGAVASAKGIRDSTSDGYIELIDLLKVIARNESQNYHWLLQSESISALAPIIGENVLPLCDGKTSYPFLQAGQLRGAGLSGSPEGLPLLEKGVMVSSPVVACGALDGLKALAVARSGNAPLLERIRTATLRALESRDVAVTATAASLLGDPPLASGGSVTPLLSRLARLRVPDDIEAFQEICSSLGKLGDRSAVPPLLDLLQIEDPAVANAAAAALQGLTGMDYRGRIPRRAEPVHTDFDFAKLWSLPETIRVELSTARGSILIDLDRNAAPFTVMTILKLADQKGFFRGSTFHRVVPNFVIQGGDPRGDGWGGPGFTIRSEFSPLRYETGTVGIASAGKDTEGSQFFITHSPQPHLDGRYTIIGRVVAGQDIVDRMMIDDRIFDLTVVTDPGGR